MVASINMCKATEEREKKSHAVPQASSSICSDTITFPFTMWCCPFPPHIGWLLWPPWRGVHRSNLLHWEGSPAPAEQPWPFCHICVSTSLGSFVPLTVTVQLVPIQWVELSVLSLVYWKNNACFQCCLQQQLFRGTIPGTVNSGTYPEFGLNSWSPLSRIMSRSGLEVVLGWAGPSS